MKHIIVVGAGAAGLMAATIAAREGAKVTLIEKMNMIGKKWGLPAKAVVILPMMLQSVILSPKHRGTVSSS